ncbi:hypothetical protein [Flavobacterium luteum]|uniref:Porin family protein n=1 Tax=Flavobacterium luteum TaxID=2026654 RepID=A0A7J5A9T0_9FLAO|nr:hypothetical protein [Flavobacterium luteum]KAB1154324.1 hypothetical protein F6464_13150 [Flavobacterium luteum]
MKKIILTAAAVFAFSFANAQDLKSKKGENYLPEAGDWAIGFNADGIFNYVGNAFNGNTDNSAPSVSFQKAGTFVGKKFITDKTAYRVVANFAVGSNSETIGSEETVVSGLDLAAGLGKEWRKGKTRLQGFYGADALLMINSSKTKITDTGYEKVTTSGMKIGVGINGFIGAEYFLFPKMSIGAQYGYGLNIGIGGEGKITETGEADIKTGKSTDINLGGVSVSSINLTLHF